MTGPVEAIIIRHQDLDTLIAEALTRLVVGEKRGGDDGRITVIFAGEGAAADSALLDALEDMRERCAALGCAPVAVHAEPMLRTDTGVRIWGTLSCDTVAPAAFPDVSAIDLEQEGDLWTLKITAS